MSRAVAWFITPHGFGHATRSAAIMAAMSERNKDLHFHVFSTVPGALIAESLGDRFTLEPLSADVGLVQRDALVCDLNATLAALDQMLPFDPSLVGQVASTLRDRGCEGVVCDVAAFGIAAGEAAGLPVALVENFTWDWIYEAYVAALPGFEQHIRYLRRWYGSVDLHLRTEPLCNKAAGGEILPPIARPRRQPRAAVRAFLGVPPGKKMVLLTMGGVDQGYPFLQRLYDFPEVVFVLPGHAHVPGTNVLGLSKFAGIYHPDLISAADLVVAKLGYSTIAEVVACGVPMAFVGRADFRESAPLAGFMNRRGSARCLGEKAFLSGAWLDQLGELLAMARLPDPMENGAALAAGRLLSLLGD